MQLAVALDADVVATARGSDAEFVRGLGARRVLDYADGRFEEELHDVDVVFDTVGPAAQSRSWQILRRGGVLVSVAAPPDQDRARRRGRAREVLRRRTGP